MTTESSGSRTKNDLDRALRQLLENRPLDQLRIRELTALCGIRRQSFYYHFPDVYALFDWSLEQEKRHLAVRQGQCLTWQQAMRDLLGHVDRHRRYYQVLLESQGRMGLRRVLGESLSGMLAQADGYYRLRCGVSRTAESAGLLSGWETLLLALVESWIQGDLSGPPETLIGQLETLAHQGAAAAAWRSVVVQES